MATLNWEEKKHLTRLGNEAKNGSEVAEKEFYSFLHRNIARLDAQAMDMTAESIDITPQNAGNYKDIYHSLLEHYDRINVAAISARSNIRLELIREMIKEKPPEDVVRVLEDATQVLLDATIFGYVPAKGADTSMMDDCVIVKKTDISALEKAAEAVRESMKK